MMKFSFQPIVAFLGCRLHYCWQRMLPYLLSFTGSPCFPLLPFLNHWHIFFPLMSGCGTTIHGGTEYRLEDRSCFDYCYKNNGKKLDDNANTALFFLEEDLKAGHKMNLLFKQASNQAFFLPREIVKSIPFSSNKVAEILNEFAVKPGSINAEVMKNTIELCEDSGIKREEKYCATSLESLVDFITSKLGRHVEALSTEVVMETKKHEYTIMHGVKKVGVEKKVVVCHKLSYVHAVFYCHKIENTVAYTVSLKGADGSKVKAISVCHRDTSQWNPKHLAFQMLKVKPGSVPICHFLFQDTIAWVQTQIR
ncbi:BURP domain protein RD22-like isoform X2 [Prosopis cineraria]|uniref:BURP domain protein RD22-like isoform X2 n=2 Tax=Prosopis cineraria TaxID=364024 RepID=UPI00240FA9E3|nr:BURP domain protein RD22-like isoform X2 [Prosopis cineraria]